jgi:pantoate--beta-alanine ligase
MELVRRIHMMRELSREARSRGRKIALVPTMGALHDGHLSLVRRARELADFVVVSVFVNPKQFGPAEDFDHYPRDLARDTDLCIQEGVEYLFSPSAEEMYPRGYRTYVDVEGLSSVYEGARRPGHFRGVATVVLKLFNIVQPHFAFFGQKDGQQALILRKMVEDLNVGVEMIVCPTQRDTDGLALSSRNVYLSREQREAALSLHRALEKARTMVEEQGVRDARQVERSMRGVLDATAELKTDYLAITDAKDLRPVDVIDDEVMIALAAWIGEVRLIDNVVVSPPRSATTEHRGEA